MEGGNETFKAQVQSVILQLSHSYKMAGWLSGFPEGVGSKRANRVSQIQPQQALAILVAAEQGWNLRLFRPQSVGLRGLLARKHPGCMYIQPCQ